MGRSRPITGAGPCSAAATSSSASSLLALGPVVPRLHRAHRPGRRGPGKDTVLVVVEMTGGNDGLNTVIPYARRPLPQGPPDPRLSQGPGRQGQRRARPAPGLAADRQQLLQQSKLAVVQGVGYPNPDRSHFESMDIWQPATDPKRERRPAGSAERAADLAKSKGGGVPVMHVGGDKLPLACRGPPGGVFSINQEQPFRAEARLPGSAEEAARKKLLDDLAASARRGRATTCSPSSSAGRCRRTRRSTSSRDRSKDQASEAARTGVRATAACTPSSTSSPG